MKIENERRFLVTALAPDILKRGIHVRQGYLGIDPPVRVRIENNQKGFLTIKLEDVEGKLELEYEIPFREAELLLGARKHHLIEKMRYRVDRFEVDIFLGRLGGLVRAEIELEFSGEEIEIPRGLTVREVTQDKRFENHNLAQLDNLPKEWRCKIVSRSL